MRLLPEMNPQVKAWRARLQDVFETHELTSEQIGDIMLALHEYASAMVAAALESERNWTASGASLRSPKGSR